MRIPAVAPLLAAFALLLLLLTPDPFVARPEFARLTGNPCSTCHISPQGGSAFKGEGEQFRQELKTGDQSLKCIGYF